MTGRTRDRRPLYKYLRAEHAVALLRRGQILVSTLYACRDVEARGEAAGDASEGLTTIHQYVPDHLVTEEHPLTGPMASRVHVEKGVAGIRFVNCTASQVYDVDDHFLYCTAQEFSQEAMESFGYNACLRIDEPHRFFSAITRQLRDRGLVTSEWGCHACIYSPRDQLHGGPTVHPLLLKDPSFAGQREVRAYWKPSSEPIAPMLIESLTAARYCSAHDASRRITSTSSRRK